MHPLPDDTVVRRQQRLEENCSGLTKQYATAPNPSLPS
jgi:hypothetical protein